MLTFPKHTKSHFVSIISKIQKYQFLHPKILSGYNDLWQKDLMTYGYFIGN